MFCISTGFEIPRIMDAARIMDATRALQPNDRGRKLRSENSGVAELKEDGQVSCDTAHNPALNLFVHYATRPRRSPAARRRLDLRRLLLQH